MKMSLDNAPYIDQASGQPVEGRIRICLHNTNVLAEVFTIEGPNYVVAPNPQLVHGGYPEASLFAELGIIDIYLEKYIGEEGMMSVDSPDEDFAPLDVFEWGLDYSISDLTQNRVDTVDDLRNANPDLKVVEVTWYSEPGDCCPRTYIWDELSQNDEDGGYVVRSDISDTGRWILLWGDEVLPCTVYGVNPRDESNINLLLNYPETVGSFALRTAPCVRFLRGTYTSTVDYATPKELCFDNGATFLNSTFVCKSLRVFGQPSTYLADFQFTGPVQEAHSSWFRTIAGFLSCDAEKLVVDKTNNFNNTQINSTYALSNQTLEYAENTRLPVQYINNGRISLSRVNIIGNGIFNANDKLTFAYMYIHDEWWQNPSSIDWVTNVRARTTNLNTLLLANFKSVDAYVNAVKANGDTVLDLAGRRTTSVAIGTSTDNITELRNVQCTNLTIHRAGADVVLRDVHAENVIATCRYITTHDNCDISFSTEPSVMACWFNDSRVNASTQWYNSKQVIAENCWIGIVFNYAHDNVTDHAVLDFTECRFQTNVSFYVKRISMKRCVTSNNTIKIYPYKSGDHYYLNCNFENNVFNNNSPIEFTKFDTLDGAYQDDVYDCIINWGIVGNTFAGNDEGLRCRYWQHRSGSNYGKRFIARLLYHPAVNPDDVHHSYVYKGNIGNCPKENFTDFAANKNNFVNNSQWPSWNTCATAYESVFPPLNQCVSDSPFCWGYLGSVSPKLMSYDVNNSGNFGGLVYAPALYAAFYNVDNEEVVENGSLFKIGLGWESASLAWSQLKEFIVAR